MRDLSVVDVVPLDVLLEVLGSDARPVAERLHRLLLPSYFGSPEEGPACVAALLRQNAEVASCTAPQCSTSIGCRSHFAAQPCC